MPANTLQAYVAIWYIIERIMLFSLLATFILGVAPFHRHLIFPNPDALAPEAIQEECNGAVDVIGDPRTNWIRIKKDDNGHYVGQNYISGDFTFWDPKNKADNCPKKGSKEEIMDAYQIWFSFAAFTFIDKNCKTDDCEITILKVKKERKPKKIRNLIKEIRETDLKLAQMQQKLAVLKVQKERQQQRNKQFQEENKEIDRKARMIAECRLN